MLSEKEIERLKELISEVALIIKLHEDTKGNKLRELITSHINEFGAKLTKEDQKKLWKKIKSETGSTKSLVMTLKDLGIAYTYADNGSSWKDLIIAIDPSNLPF